jgi:hypothetical protein
MKMRKGRIKELLELAKKDPKAILQALEAKARLTAGEFVVWEEARQRLAAKTCRYCGRVFLPKRKTQNFCAPACRVAFYARRSLLWHRIRKLRTKYRAMKDEQFRNRWMARINALRAKEGRPPYWNAYENRPYTKDEVVLMRSPVSGSLEPIVRSSFVSQPPATPQPKFGSTMTSFPASANACRHDEFRNSEQPMKVGEQHFLTLKFLLFGSEQTRQLPVKPNAHCSHQNWRSARVGWQNEPAQICLACGAIKLVSEGTWRYLPEGTVWVDL